MPGELPDVGAVSAADIDDVLDPSHTYLESNSTQISWQRWLAAPGFGCEWGKDHGRWNRGS